MAAACGLEIGMSREGAVARGLPPECTACNWQVEDYRGSSMLGTPDICMTILANINEKICERRLVKNSSNPCPALTS